LDAVLPTTCLLKKQRGAWSIDSSCRHRDLCSLVRLDPEFATDVSARRGCPSHPGRFGV
jgi:hypothetical protein